MKAIVLAVQDDQTVAGAIESLQTLFGAQLFPFFADLADEHGSARSVWGFGAADFIDWRSAACEINSA